MQWKRFSVFLTTINKVNLILSYLHNDIIKWQHFPRYLPFVREIHQSPVDSPDTGQWHEALTFSLICLKKNLLNKQLGRRWFETPSCSLSRRCNVKTHHWYFAYLLRKTSTYGCRSVSPATPKCMGMPIIWIHHEPQKAQQICGYILWDIFHLFCCFHGSYICLIVFEIHPGSVTLPN